MFKSKGHTSKPPTIQLGKSSWSAATRCSKLSSSLTSEIIDDELEQAQLQADTEVEEMERQAAIDRAERQAAMARDEMERQAAIDRARDKAKVFKKQAQIQAKLRKQQSLQATILSKVLNGAHATPKAANYQYFVKSLTDGWA